MLRNSLGSTYEAYLRCGDLPEIEAEVRKAMEHAEKASVLLWDIVHKEEFSDSVETGRVIGTLELVTRMLGDLIPEIKEND